MRNKRTSGFTLLELLVVVAILVIVAGGLIAAYDGLETKSAQGVATFNLGALDSSIRTFRATNAGQYPNEMDSLLFSASGTGTDAAPLNILPPNLRSVKLGGHTLTDEGVSALAAVGITRARYVSGALGYDNSPVPEEGGTGTQISIPNRSFDNPTRGAGAAVGLATGVVLAAVESGDIVTDFGGGAADFQRLRDIAQLDDQIGHVVIAFGIGNNSTLVGEAGTIDPRTASLSQAPFYKNVPPYQYSRYVALFHIASDADGNGSIEAGECFAAARFVGVIDAKGDWYEEEEAGSSGVKQ